MTAQSPADRAGSDAEPTHVLYLHGFRSSPRSFKARLLAGWVAEHRPSVHWWCPQLPPSPREALALVMDGIAGWPAQRSVVLGSSLGGYYAAVVAQATGWPVVVMNPAVEPARDLAAHLGEHTAWHAPQQRLVFAAAHLDELRAMAAAAARPARRSLALIAKGDEVLDWREMLARWQHGEVLLLEGSDHGLSDFDRHLPRLLAFLGWTV